MTDAPEATSFLTPQAPATEPTTFPTASSHDGQTDAPGAPGVDSTDASTNATESGDGEAGAARAVSRTRRSRGGRGRRRPGQVAPDAAGDTLETSEAEGAADGAGNAHAETQGDRAADAPVGATPNRDARRDGGSRRQPDASRPPRRTEPVQKQTQPAARQQQLQASRNKVHPVLQRLFELYPSMFGARFLPLKLGVYQDLLERHGDEFKTEDLKIALGLHARSTRYLDAVAAGHQRHDLEGRPVEPVAPEHVHHAILEVFRRRQSRTPDDLSAALRDRIIAAIEASGIGRDAYAERVRARDVKGNAALDDALAELGRQGAKREALLRAFETTGKTEAEFADMYGMEMREVTRTLQRARKDRADAQAFAEASAAKAAADQASPSEPDDDTATDGAFDGDMAAETDSDVDAEASAGAQVAVDSEEATDATLDHASPSKPQA